MKKIFIIVLFVMSWMFFDTAEGADWAQFGRYENENRELTERPEAVMFGNSITDFWIERDSAFFAENHLADRGISGQTTVQMLARFRQDVLNLNPKAVVIMAGINDIAENNGPITLENVLGNIQSMCELAELHKIKVVLCSVTPCDSFPWNPDIKPAAKIFRLNDMIKKYAEKKGIPYVDYYSAMVGKRGEMRPELTVDGCHPNLKGYKVMEPIVLGVIKKITTPLMPKYS